MKNQYIGDVGDFGKYSLLKEFSEEDIRIGINWYLTENDGSNDGKFTDYLDDESMRCRCPEVFDVLKGIANKHEKTVGDIQRSGIIKDALYFDELLKTSGKPREREIQRNQWFSRSMDALAGAELIFMDPDNGLLESNDASKTGREKYVLPDEVASYFNKGHDVVYYCHKGRRTHKEWLDYKSIMFDIVPSAKPAILTYHKGSQRSYVFLIHEESFVRYRKIIDRFERRWGRIFSEEYTKRGDMAGKTIGEAFTIMKSDGSIVTIQNRADGQVQMISSKSPNTIIILTADSFCQRLGLSM